MTAKGANRQWPLHVYIGVIGLTTLAVAVYSVVEALQLPPLQLVSQLPEVLFFIGLGWISSRHRVLVTESGSWAMGSTAYTATVLTLPLPLAITAVLFAKSATEIWKMVRERQNWRHLVVNSGSMVLASAAAGAAFQLLQGHQYLWSAGVQALFAFPALAALGLLFVTVDILVVVGAITLSNAEAPWSVFIRICRGALQPELSLILVGIVFAVIWHYSVVLSLFVAAPILLSLRAFESVARLRQETILAVLKMSESIDYRDTGTYEHSKRLTNSTERLARALGLTPEHVADIVLAARVHDMGKIGISNEILLKPGPLTPEERRIMEEHPIIGADILASYSAFQDAVPIVRHHHERWDGNGYPEGLRGEEIPLGSRIIAVADAYDAMTDDRPYRRGMSPAVAVERLKADIGSHFDPKVCAAFIQLLIEDGTYEPMVRPASLHLVPKEVAPKEAG